mmetsp:Transcript_11919/g.14884  ORF Transcript_11919/g.14884 Transcript_11919/m.14884 type:complete len:116 (-) Transcript_11919:790-1137(-)
MRPITMFLFRQYICFSVSEVTESSHSFAPAIVSESSLDSAEIDEYLSCRRPVVATITRCLLCASHHRIICTEPRPNPQFLYFRIDSILQHDVQESMDPRDTGQQQVFHRAIDDNH